MQNLRNSGAEWAGLGFPRCQGRVAGLVTATLIVMLAAQTARAGRPHVVVSKRSDSLAIEVARSPWRGSRFAFKGHKVAVDAKEVEFAEQATEGLGGKWTVEFEKNSSARDGDQEVRFALLKRGKRVHAGTVSTAPNGMPMVFVLTRQRWFGQRKPELLTIVFWPDGPRRTMITPRLWRKWKIAEVKEPIRDLSAPSWGGYWGGFDDAPSRFGPH